MNSSHVGCQHNSLIMCPLVSTFWFQCLVRKSPNSPSGQTLWWFEAQSAYSSSQLCLGRTAWGERDGRGEIRGWLTPSCWTLGYSLPFYAGMAAAAAHSAVSGSPPPRADPSPAHECSIVWGRTLVLVATYWAIHGFDL
jgi:hypothetical protein